MILRIFLPLWAICFPLLLVSCETNFSALYPHKGAGIILTFDDHDVTDWFKADSIFQKYFWKATFCVSNFSSLNGEEINDLQILQGEGHEIACHSATHLNAVEFVKAHSLKEYLDTDIFPAIQAMKAHNLDIQSFAYPYGERNWDIDKELLKYFKILRGTVGNTRLPSQQFGFANGTQVVYALGIDRHYGNDLNYLLSLLDYAEKSDRIAIFYGHAIKEDDSRRYVTSYHTLEGLCNFIVEHDMQFFTLKDLAK